MILMVAVPMVAALIAVIALAVLGRRLALELTSLRRSLRLVGAASVAVDELRRASAAITDQAAATAAQARLRVGRPRPAGRRYPR